MRKPTAGGTASGSKKDLRDLTQHAQPRSSLQGLRGATEPRGSLAAASKISRRRGPAERKGRARWSLEEHQRQRTEKLSTTVSTMIFPEAWRRILKECECEIAGPQSGEIWARHSAAPAFVLREEAMRMLAHSCESWFKNAIRQTSEICEKKTVRSHHLWRASLMVAGRRDSVPDKCPERIRADIGRNALSSLCRAATAKSIAKRGKEAACHLMWCNPVPSKYHFLNRKRDFLNRRIVLL